MDIATMSKQELINSILSAINTAPVHKNQPSDADFSLYNNFIADVNDGNDATVELPIEFALRNDMFEMIKSGEVYISQSVKFNATFTTDKPVCDAAIFTARYRGFEFDYSFLDNHPGIINIDRLKDIPTDYEGLMAVPLTVLEYKNLMNFNVHRIIYNPKHNGHLIYARVVISNKTVNS